MIHLNEFRQLRDSYATKAVDALTRRFTGSGRKEWVKVIERAKIVPLGDIDGLRVYLPLFNDIGEWAALDRFCKLSEIVWEMECEELAVQMRKPYDLEIKAA